MQEKLENHIYRHDRSTGLHTENILHLMVIELCIWIYLSSLNLEEYKIWFLLDYSPGTGDVCPCIFLLPISFWHLLGIIWIQTSPNDWLWVPLRPPFAEKLCIWFLVKSSVHNCPNLRAKREVGTINDFPFLMLLNYGSMDCRLFKRGIWLNFEDWCIWGGGHHFRK